MNHWLPPFRFLKPPLESCLYIEAVLYNYSNAGMASFVPVIA